VSELFGFGNRVGLATLVKRELVRTMKVINQVIWPPIITTVLYVMVFGLSLGSRIPQVQGVSYAAYLVPGLIMLQVIDATYSEVSSSIFQGRFMNSIQEMLIAPMSAVEMVAGYVIASVLRALLIASLALAYRRAAHRIGSLVGVIVDWGVNQARRPALVLRPGSVDELEVVEHVQGNATTDFGAPGVPPAARRPSGRGTCR